MLKFGSEQQASAGLEELTDHVGYVILVMFAIASAGLAIMLTAFRDADSDAVTELNNGTLPPAQGPVSYNYWPIIGAVGLGTLVIGLVTHTAIFVVGLILILTTAFELMMSAWADRATGDSGSQCGTPQQNNETSRGPSIGSNRNSRHRNMRITNFPRCVKILGHLVSSHHLSSRLHSSTSLRPS